MCCCCLHFSERTKENSSKEKLNIVCINEIWQRRADPLHGTSCERTEKKKKIWIYDPALMSVERKFIVYLMVDANRRKKKQQQQPKEETVCKKISDNFKLQSHQSVINQEEHTPHSQRSDSDVKGKSSRVFKFEKNYTSISFLHIFSIEKWGKNGLWSDL